ncbi:MAG: hypothetical protein K6B46_03220 [Opitutales bacterium]|nr:hypothetical protein [Opitutales bacterium]
MNFSCRLFFVVLFFVGNAILSAGTALNPEPQHRDPYDWDARHEEVCRRNKKLSPDYIFIGDSIVHHWGGEPASVRPPAQGADSWERLFAKRKVTNAGFGFDYIDNAYYRVENGELDGFKPRVILILLGTNNLFHLKDKPDVCVDKMKSLLKLVQKKQPRAKILLIGVLPRKEPASPSLIGATNEGLKKLADGKRVFYLDASLALAQKNGEIADSQYMRDVVHPNKSGYERLALQIEEMLKQIERSR